MKFFQFVCADPTGEPYAADQDNVLEWLREAAERKVLVEGARLRPPEDATLVRVRQGEVLVTDGPFAETKEWIAGFGVLECRDWAEAVELTSRHPMARFGRVELRPFWADSQ